MSTPASLPSRAAIVIVGGGMAGLSCAASLARRGVGDVVLLEAQTLAHAKASSYGETRMFREMYSDPVLCRLAQEANRLWREEENHAGQQLRETHGLLFYGESWDEETIEGSIPGARRVMDDQGIPYEALNADQIAARFPLKPKPGFTGLFEPTAGAVRSDRVVAHWINTARNASHQLIEHCPVAGLDADGGGVTLESGEHIAAGQLVVACGIWSQLLLAPLGLSPKLEVWPMLWAHYTVEPALADRYPQWFCFRKEVPDLWDGGLYYGFPCEGDESVIKVGIDFCPDHPEFRMRDMADYVRRPNAKIVKLIDDFVRENWVGVGERVDMYSSPYTCTRDQYFVLDRLPSHEEVTLFTGGCGRAFKFAPLLGKLLAEKTLGMAPSHDIAPFSAARECVQWPKVKAMA